MISFCTCLIISVWSFNVNSSFHGHPSLSSNFMVFKWPFPGPLVSQSRTRVLVLILLVFLILWFCDLWSFLMCIFWGTIWLRVLCSFPSKYLLLKPSLHFWPWHMPKVLMFCFDLWLDPIKMWPWLKWLHGKRHIRMCRSHSCHCCLIGYNGFLFLPFFSIGVAVGASATSQQSLFLNTMKSLF